MNEEPKFVHGRLAEAVHHAGYSFERAYHELEWLLEDDRWKECGNGFNKIDDFLATIKFSEFKIAAEKRKKIAKQLTDLRATQRAVAGTLGVTEATINRDIKPITNVTQSPEIPAQQTELIEESVTNVTPPHVSYNTGENEWYTPPEIIKKARVVMGEIDLDPASSKEANTVVKAKKYYTINDNGLLHSWNGRIWMNPPYAVKLIPLFIEKLLVEFTNNNITEAIVLVNNATETKWFQTMFKYMDAVCFPLGRIQYWNPQKETAGPLQGQSILYFGINSDRFYDFFTDVGGILFNGKR